METWTSVCCLGFNDDRMEGTTPTTENISRSTKNNQIITNDQCNAFTSVRDKTTRNPKFARSLLKIL